MPITLQGNPSSQNLKGTEVFRKDFGYDYPAELNLRPGTDLHDKIVRRIVERAQASQNIMAKYKPSWREVDKVLKIYMSPEQKEGKNQKSKKVGNYADMVIPESYASMETILTYYMASFIQAPLFNYEGVGPEDVIGARLLTHLIDHQARSARMGLNLHTMFRDDTAYGFGVLAPTWRRTYGRKPKVKQYGRMNEAGFFEILREETTFDNNALLYEGNQLENINPYLYLQDVSVPIHEPERGAYQGWVEETTLENLLTIEEDPGSNIFNVKYLRELDNRSNFGLTDKQNTRDATYQMGDVSRPADVIWMYVDLIPQDWEIGDEEYPRKWLFGVSGGDRVIISAQEVDYMHGRTPVVVCATNFDGYSATPISKLSMVHDIQTLINFMYTSHVQNVRKALNDMFIIDPSIINYYDVINPEPGKVIRTRRAAWGNQMLDHAFKQLNITDVTQQHVGEANMLGELMRRISATGDTVQGSLASRTTRVSSREAGNVMNASLSRFQKNAQIIDMQAIQPLALMLASHTQQFMEEDTYLTVSGDWPATYLSDLQDVDGRLYVSPLDLMVNYDVLPSDGSIPGSEDPQIWTQLFQIASSNPVLAQQTDWMKLFKHLARNLGAKNVDEFIVRVQPDEEIMQAEQAGNLVPEDQEI